MERAVVDSATPPPAGTAVTVTNDDTVSTVATVATTATRAPTMMNGCGGAEDRSAGGQGQREALVTEPVVGCGWWPMKSALLMG